jgi:hypothetical protein
MVIVPSLGARLGVASGPDACVHGVDRSFSAPCERMADEQLAQDLRVDTSTG